MVGTDQRRLLPIIVVFRGALERRQPFQAFYRLSLGDKVGGAIFRIPYFRGDQITPVREFLGHLREPLKHLGRR